MPTYEYYCTKCEQRFEAVQSMKDPHFKECPQALCRLSEWGHGEVKRQLGTGAGLIFKGTGFYITDYRSDKYKEAAKKDAPSSGSSSGGEGAKPAESPKTPAAPAPPSTPKPEAPKPAPRPRRPAARRDRRSGPIFYSMATTTLVCKQCNFENEPERVYCHNCGAKLDRSLLPPEASKRADPVVVQERVRKIISPRRGSGSRWLRHLVSSLVLAALLACIVLIIKPPDGIPEPIKDASINAPSVTDDMEGLAAQPTAGRLDYPEDKINAFLQTFSERKDANAGSAAVKFTRAYVHFDEGRVRVTYVQSIFGLPLYATSVDTVKIENGQVVAEPVAGSFGRLPISPKIMPYFNKMFSPLWKVLERDKNIIAKMGAITFHDKKVEMINKPGVPTR